MKKIKVKAARGRLPPATPPARTLMLGPARELRETFTRVTEELREPPQNLIRAVVDRVQRRTHHHVEHLLVHPRAFLEHTLGRPLRVPVDDYVAVDEFAPCEGCGQPTRARIHTATGIPWHTGEWCCDAISGRGKARELPNRHDRRRAGLPRPPRG